MENKELLFKIEDLKQYFPIGKKPLFGKHEQLFVRANDGITVNIHKGETLGLVGESGCGKSTLGRSILQLYEQTDGRTIYYGTTIHDIDPKYVRDTIRGYVDKKKKFLAADKKRDEQALKLETLTDEAERLQALEDFQNIDKEARQAYYDIAELAGALILSDEDAKVSELILGEYNAKVEIAKIKNSIKAYGKNTKSELTAEDKKKLEGLEAKVATNDKALAALLETVKSHPHFDKHEAERDDGVNLAKLTGVEMRDLRDQMQLIFQDPYSSLNPRLTVGQIIAEGLNAHEKFRDMDERQEYILKVMDDCGLAPYFIHRYPHQFSGGQRQRIGIARSVALQPEFIVCDEAVSALDVSIQSQIINLLIDLKEQENLTYLFISHDLSVIKYISDRVAVMYLGNIVELADTEELYAHPMHPYTEALLAAIPTTDTENKKEIEILEGDIPSPIRPPKGCKFHTRCKYADEICRTVTPLLQADRPGHFVACHHSLNK